MSIHQRLKLSKKNSANSKNDSSKRIKEMRFENLRKPWKSLNMVETTEENHRFLFAYSICFKGFSTKTKNKTKIWHNHEKKFRRNCEVVSWSMDIQENLQESQHILRKNLQKPTITLKNLKESCKICDDVKRI